MILQIFRERNTSSLFVISLIFLIATSCSSLNKNKYHTKSKQLLIKNTKEITPVFSNAKIEDLIRKMRVLSKKKRFNSKDFEDLSKILDFAIHYKNLVQTLSIFRPESGLQFHLRVTV